MYVVGGGEEGEGGKNGESNMETYITLNILRKLNLS